MFQSGNNTLPSTIQMFYSSNTEEVNVVTERKVDIMRHKEIILLNELCNGSNKEFNTIVEKTQILIGLFKKSVLFIF